MTILKLIWTYGIQLWRTIANSNIDILQRFLSKVLGCITNAPWYVPNDVIQRDLQMTTVKEEIHNHSSRYQNRLKEHPNKLIETLLKTTLKNKRLNRFYQTDLLARFKLFTTV